MPPRNLDEEKHVYLIRHAKQIRDPKGDLWQVNAELAPGSEAKVIALIHYFRDQNICFSGLYHSTLTRSLQTAQLIRKFGELAVVPTLLETLSPGQVDLWNKNWEGLKLFEPDIESNPNIHWPEEFHRRWAPLCEEEGARVLSAVYDIAKKLGIGEKAAAVGHNPLISYAQAAATGSLSGPELSNCQFIKFSFTSVNTFVAAEAFHVV